MTPTAITIGVFDGVHLGHQALLLRAKASGLPVVALTFDPHPACVFAPTHVPQLLGTLAERIALLTAAGADRVQVLPFDRALAAQAPEEFYDQVLRPLQPALCVVGDDFRFGRDRRGDTETLRALGVPVAVVAPVLVDGVPARSTTIRQRVESGQVQDAARLLGRPYALRGTVVHGRKLGRTIGYPTANLVAEQGILVPGSGVYAGVARLAGGRRVRAAISVGTNPTVRANGPVTVEAFLMDGFNEDLYDQSITLEFVHFLRGTVQFPGLEPLLEQMARDVERCKQLITL